MHGNELLRQFVFLEREREVYVCVWITLVLFKHSNQNQPLKKTLRPKLRKLYECSGIVDETERSLLMLEQWLTEKCHYKVHLVTIQELLIISHDLLHQMS